MVSLDTPALPVCIDLLTRLGEHIEKRALSVRANSSTEALHDFRVVVRKTRSLLAILDDVLPEPGLSKFRRAFSTAMKKTGLLRDLEGFCAEFAHYKFDDVDHDLNGLGPLLVFVEQQERSERIQVQEYLGSAAYIRLMRDWLAYLQQALTHPVSGQDTLKRADVPIADIARMAIENSYLRTARRAATIRKSNPATVFHKLRKSYKQLRYLMEIFRQVLPAHIHKEISKQLKKLQARLGSLQDLEVQIEIINRSVDEIRDQLQKENKKAIKSLTKKIKSRRKQLKAEAAELIWQFSLNSAEKFAHLLQVGNIAEVSVKNCD